MCVFSSDVVHTLINTVHHVCSFLQNQAIFLVLPYGCNYFRETTVSYSMFLMVFETFESLADCWPELSVKTHELCAFEEAEISLPMLFLLVPLPSVAAFILRRLCYFAIIYVIFVCFFQTWFSKGER